VETAIREDVWELLEQQLKQEVRLNWNRSGPLVLAIDSEKGGVGKSGLAGGLIAVMAANGYRVCGIDLDPRATLTEELGAEDGEFSVNDVLYIDPEADPDDMPPLKGSAAQALRPAGEAWGENVLVLAAERVLANREYDPTSIEDRLRVSLEGVVDRFHLVVIDLPPRAGGKLVGAGLRAATHVIFPGTLDADGYIGVKDATRTWKVMEQTNARQLTEVGVLRNIVDRKTELGKLFDGKFAADFGDRVLPIAIPRRVIRQEARAACVPITASNSSGARDLVNGYTFVLNHLGRAA
jgi:chromosome partitioning protein